LARARHLGRDLRPEEVHAFTGIARRIGALILMEPELDGNYQAVKGSTRPLR
jgi:hypothetical protein